MIEEIIQKFGKNNQLEGITFKEENVIQLHTEEAGDLFFEKVENPPENILLIYKVNEYPNLNIKMLHKVLELCREDLPFSIHPGLYDENIVIFSIKIKEEKLSVALIKKAVETLMECQYTIQLIAKS